MLTWVQLLKAQTFHGLDERQKLGHNIRLDEADDMEFVRKHCA